VKVVLCITSMILKNNNEKYLETCLEHYPPVKCSYPLYFWKTCILEFWVQLHG